MNESIRQRRSPSHRRLAASARRLLAGLVLVFTALSTALAGGVPACCLPIGAPTVAETKPACCSKHASTGTVDVRAIPSHPAAPSAPPCCDAGICCRTPASHVVHQGTHASGKQAHDAVPAVPSGLSALRVALAVEPRVANAPAPPPRSAVRTHLLNRTILC